MKQKILLLSIMMFMVILVFNACEDEDENETVISSYTSDDSHRAGQDCMTCHKSGGSGDGWFTVAGTVYNKDLTSVYPGATVKIYSESNGGGTLIAIIEVDKNGNFYTTKNIDFGAGVYTLVEGNTTTKNMMSTITHGKCNSCHGNTVSKIWVE